MAVFRIEKNKNYTCMSNYHLADARLSLKAKGLLSLMLSLPEGWDYSLAGLVSICQEGKDAVRSTLDELTQFGYVFRARARNDDGTLAGNDYLIYEQPQESAHDSPTAENPPQDEPTAEKPTLDKPTLGNPPQLSTNTSKYVTNSPKAPQRGRSRREKKEAPDWKPDRFAGFWDYYPRGESRQAAIAAWDKLQPSDELIAIMGQALTRQMATENWQHGIGIPYASTWLNGSRWEDVVKVPPAARTTGGGFWAPDPEVIRHD